MRHPLDTPDNWRKSSYSGDGDGNNCVEITNSPTHISVRDSKSPTNRILSFPVPSFTTFLQSLKSPTPR
ncbi:hypothetical protein SLINC_5080 [Streptomyces lincolnensis]|uniref:Uncharacterized protein n=1 Tax=Streptomyces lincolnensis TaxID=1915 RepID=A0A1B1MFG3_STRLN|nr:DUF397 domain-containing protein [Streptomyces lincolnensis]ANS67304.1 hypothetical protein SLINC_5080 [Streptomyces lincolnensis]AXG56175.1 hypothetical protein SLCG_5020 [Streptomyces lincolnensis]QMV07361.1 DUF397 domain-containing protein [Streptomyces lincolnensis]